MAPAQFTLFPTSQTSNGVSRRPSLRRLHTDKAPDANGQMQLNGVAFQVVSSHKAQPASGPIQHSLFCDPASGMDAAVPSTASNTGLVRRQSKTRRRSSPVTPPMPSASDFGSPDGDNLAELPLNTHFGKKASPIRSRSLLKRPDKPGNISTQVPQAMCFASPIEEKKDAVSPLPNKTRFMSPSPQSEYARSISCSPARSSGHASPMRSIFPRYDPSIPLDEQQYYPTIRAPPPSYSSPVTREGPSPIQKGDLRRFDSAVGLVDRYEHIPAAGHGDLEALWKASIESFPCDGRKAQFSLFQPSANNTSLAIGTSPQDIIYSMERHPNENGSSDANNSYDIKKHCPTAPTSLPVSQIILPDPTSTASKTPPTTSIFPQMAALAALKAISNPPQAAEIATFDPSASSPEAAHLAQTALSLAHQTHACHLTKRTRTRKHNHDNLLATYDLKHPILGTMAITITKSSASQSQSQTFTSRNQNPKNKKISLHHPSATPAAIEADTLNLAFLDFANQACVLDLPGLLALAVDWRYVVDMVVSTLFAVAGMEMEMQSEGSSLCRDEEKREREAMSFDPPPKSVTTTTTRRGSLSLGKRKKKKNKDSKKSEPGDNEHQQQQLELEQVELPGFGRAVVGLSWMAVKGAFWVLGTSVKLGVRVVKEVRSS